MSFSGAKGQVASNQVAAALEGRFQLISPSRFAAMARRQGVEVSTDRGRAAAAAVLRVAAVVDGSVRRSRGRWILSLRIYNGYDGKIFASGTFPMRSPQLDETTRARVKRRIVQVTKQARPPARRKITRSGRSRRVDKGAERRQRAAEERAAREQAAREYVAKQRAKQRAEQQQAEQQRAERQRAARERAEQQRVAGERQPVKLSADRTQTARSTASARSEQAPPGDQSLGFEVYGEQRQQPAPAGELGFAVATSKKPRPPLTDQPASRPAPALLELLLGTMIFDRSFLFRQPIDPIVPPNFKSGLIPAALFEAELFPLARLRSALWSNLGLRTRVALVPLLKTQMLGIPLQMDTTMYDLELGLLYRWNLLGRHKSPVLTFGGSFGRSVLGISWPAGLSPLPEISYHYLGAGAQLRWLFYQRGSLGLAARGGAAYQFYLSEGDLERPDSVGFGQSNTHGVEGQLGLEIVYRGFFARLWGQGRVIFLDFDNRCYTSGMGCKVARGAYDIAVGGGLGLGYLFR